MGNAFFSRRALLRASVAAGLAPLARAADGRRGFRIGVCDWMTGKGATPEALKWAAGLGLDGVQVSFGEPAVPFDLRSAEHRAAYAAAEKETGVAVASLA